MKQKFRFGIRQRTVALVLILSALQVLAVGWYLFNANKAVVIDHELVDLGDEAQLRAWEVIDRVDVLKADLRALTLDREVSRVLTESPNDVEAISAVFKKRCQEWNGYCSIKVSLVDDDEEAVVLDTPMYAEMPDADGTRTALIDELRDLARSEVRVSKAVREQADVEFGEGAPPTRKWLPVMWGGVAFRLQPIGDGDGGAIPAGVEWGPRYKVVIGLNLDSRSWASDPRHIALMVDESDMTYVIHPTMNTAATLAESDVFDWQSPQDRGARVRPGETPESLIDEIREQDIGTLQVSRDEALRRSLPPVNKVALVELLDLAPEFQRFFREGKVTESFTDRADKISQWQKEVLRAAGPGENYEDILGWRMQELADSYLPRGLRVSGLGNRVSTVRILGSTEGDVRELSKQLAREVNPLLALRVLPGEEGIILPEGTPDWAGPESDIAQDAKTIRWQSIIPCRDADLVCVRVRIDDTIAAHADQAPPEAGMSQRPAKSYWFLYVVFHDELAASIEGELWPAIRRAGLGMVIAGIIAAIASMLAVRPLIGMIEGARYLAALPGNRLHANIRKMTEEIPVDRSDEVGDIARAARKLFGTITESHRELAAHQREIEGHKEELEREVERAVAQLKVKNAELEAAADEKDKFLASVSHELRTPLTIVAGNLQLLLRKKLGEKEIGYVNKSLAASKKLEALIRDLLDIQKIIMGGMSLEAAEFDVPELLAEIEDTLQALAKKNNNVLKVNCKGIGSVYGDRVRMNQILTNLVSNSCKFTQDGSVTIDGHPWTDEGRDWMKFTVTDTGRGMNEEEQQKVFTRFYTNKKANESGTGLGLDICRRLGELMGGRVYLKESAPDVGSVFVVELPQTMNVAGRSEDKSNQEDDSSKKRRRDLTTVDAALKDYPVNKEHPPTVLVIDDEPGIQDLMSQHLSGRGYRVLAADSGEAGIEIARREKPQLITLDVMMDGSDGWDVLQSLKAHPDTASIPVVMVSILDREDKGFALGADDYITKPVDWDHMFSVLGRLTAEGKARNALIIDDDESTRLLFKSVLSKDGWEVAEAAHGGEGLEQIRKERPGVIILDLMMPEMDGFQFLKEFNRNSEWDDIPVIVVTAKEMTASERKLLDECASRVIQKGTQTAGEMLEVVQNWASRASIRDAATDERDKQS